MKNKIESFFNKLNFIIIITLIIAIPITFLVNYYFPNFLNINMNIKIYKFLVILLPIEIIIYCYKLFTKKIKINIYDFLIYLLILFGIISTKFSINYNVSLWGSIYRHEGLIQIVTYYLLFLNSRSIVKKELVIKIINSLIVVGLFQFVYSFLQVFVRGMHVFVKFDVVSYRASGFIGHPNMLGSYIVLVLLLAIGMYFLYDKNKKFYLISSILLYINLILTQSTGPFLGFCIGLVFAIFFLIKKGTKCFNFTKIILIIVSMTFLLVSVTNMTKIVSKYRFDEEFKNMFSITSDIKGITETVTGLITKGSNYVSSDADEYSPDDQITELGKLGSCRLWIWSRSLKLVPKYWLNGAGIDNFGAVFLKVDNRHVAYFDKAHNEYLQLLITQGVFALLTYLTLIGLIFITSIKSKNKLAWVLLFGFLGYSIQIFVNISVYNVAPLFFIVMGLLVGQKEIKE